jgi:hypothetical protein
MKNVKKMLAAALIATALNAGAALADDKPDQRVGEKVSTPVGDVKVDTSSRGDKTVRGTGDRGVSVTAGGDEKTRDNPKGDTRVTVGVTKEF